MSSLNCVPALHAAEEAVETLNVVTLNGTDPYLPAFVALDRAIREKILSEAQQPVAFYAEALDMVRFPPNWFEQEALTLLRKKYRHIKVDTVVTVTTVALEFAERYADLLWPDATIVFHSVPEESLAGRSLGSQTTGIPVRYEITKTIELGLALLPKIRRVVVIAGSSNYGQAMLHHARTALDHFSGIDANYLVGLPLSKLKSAVSQLAPDTMVLYLVMFRDTKGGTYVPQQVLKQIALISRAPVFGPIETYFGMGMVAGVTVPYAAQGHKVGELVLRTARGESPAELGAQPVLAGTCIADWQALRRWDIDEGRLPEICDVRFKEMVVWDQYRWQIIAGLAIVLLQALLLGALIIQRRHRQRAETEVQRSRAELVHASRLTAMGELTASISHEINQPLGAILSNADAAEMLLESDTVDLNDVKEIVADIKRDDLRASEVLKRLRSMLTSQEMERKPVQLNDTIKEVVALVRADARHRGVKIETEFTPALPQVCGDHVHLQQVMLNLILNGMDAMAEKPEDLRQLVITTSLNGSGDVEVTVSDRGDGIAPEQLPKLFESFYTTKQQGLGIGLSITRTIVEAHGGHITAQTNSEGGAIFRFVLPAVAVERALAPDMVEPVTSRGTA